MMQDLAFAIPGVDEAMGFAEIMKYVVLLRYRNKVHPHLLSVRHFAQTRQIHAILLHRL